MGIWKSKPVKQPNVPCKRLDENEDDELQLLRRTIEKDPDTFILNNLMMCVQFFENYEEDIIQIKETLASSSEAELNKILPSQKHVLLPDILQEYIAHNIIFTSNRQTGDLVDEPLQPIRIYIVHNNIEITEQQYQPEYSSLNNGITYNMMVQSSKNSGYVRLQLLDEMPYLRNLRKKEDIDETYNESDDESIYSRKRNNRNSNMMYSRQIKKKSFQTIKSRSLSNLHNDETIYEDQNISRSLSRENICNRTSSNHIKTDISSEKTWAICEELRKESEQRPSSSKSVKLKVFKPPSSVSSGYGSDSSYHTETRSTKIRRNIKHSQMNASSEIYPNAIIPPQCFEEVRINSKGTIYSGKRRPLQNSKQVLLRMAEKQSDCEAFYLNSKMFMSHFVELFVNQLAEPLGFKQNGQNYVENSIIHCNKMIKSHSLKLHRIESYEITPTIWLQWPESAMEWLDRPRSTWPNYNDIGKVKDFGCYVIPENSLNKNDPLRHENVKKNIHQEIEWQLTFPAAERYLETCMTRSQVQVYLIAMMLHKTYLRPVQDTMHGLTISHIRNKLFWLIEEDDRPSQWSDHRIGERLNKLLMSLYRCISQDEPIMPDYFIRDKNMLSKVSRQHLLHSQKQLKRITENPIMYVFHAMENIKYKSSISNKFFPRLDFAKLFKILTVQPRLAVVSPTINISRTTEEYHKEEIFNRSGELWKIARMKEQQNYSTQVVTNKTLVTRGKATDFIVDISERCAKLEGLRLAALLDFFVRHFIQMADCCHKYRSYQQKVVYLDQADRLSIILSDLTRYKNDAKAYRDKIHALRIKATTNSTRLPNEPPETPKRNVEPIFVSNLKDRFRLQDEQSQSSHEYMGEYTDKLTCEVRFKDEENVEKNIQTANATTSEESSYTSRRPLSKNQNDGESTSDTIQRVVSLTDHLSETTYI